MIAYKADAARCLHRQFEANLFMLQQLLILGCLVPVRLIQAAYLQECEGVIISQVPNPNQECSEFVHCNGDDSYYCNGDCSEPVRCYNQSGPTTSQPIAITETSSTTQNLNGQTQEISTLPAAISTTSTATTMSTNLYVICRESGQNAVYPYPANDNYYYQCISRYLLLQQCPQNFHFDESQGKCIGVNPYRL